MAETGEPLRVVNQTPQLGGRSVDVYVSRIDAPERRRVALLFRDITEQTRIAEERERHVNQLREADRRKDEFLAMLAHELRNPLTAITKAAMLADRMGDREHLAFARDVIKRQVVNLRRLVDDLLDVSRVSRGKITLNKTTLEVGPIVAAASELAQSLIEGKRHSLTIKVSDPALRFEGDRTRVEQMLGNLLSNAAKYTEPGGHIELSARRDGDQLIFAVRDDGTGIAQDMLQGIFNLFTQVDSTIDRSQGGLGIGLTLVRNLVTLHGGEIEAASEGLGKGSTYTIRLPLGTPDPKAAKS